MAKRAKMANGGKWKVDRWMDYKGMWLFNGAFAALGSMDVIPSREGRVAFAIVICSVGVLVPQCD